MIGDVLGHLRRATRFAVDVASRVGPLVVDAGRARARLVAENVALRAQLATLKRKTGRVTPDPVDRVIFAGLWHVARDAVRDVLHAFRPETLIRWHRDVDRWLHAWRSRPRTPRTPPNRTPEATRALVIDMAEKNPRWGAPRIVGELAKLEVTLALETVQRILRPDRTQALERSPPHVHASVRFHSAPHHPGQRGCPISDLSSVRDSTGKTNEMRALLTEASRN